MLSALLLYSFIYSCNAAQILGVFNHPGASHTFLGQVLLKNLAKKGHAVTMISAFPLEQPMENYTDIVLDGLLDDLNRRHKDNILTEKSKRANLKELNNMTLQHTEDTFKNPKVVKLLESNKHFDVVIIDWFFNDATLMFGEIFKAPVIYMSSFGNHLFLGDITGNSLPLAYVPAMEILTSDNMSFQNRLIITIFNLVVFGLVPLRKAMHTQLLQRLFNKSATIEELENRIALVLSNSHFSFETPRPYTPNIIPIGGFHIEETSLSLELQKFLDEAKDGVIYFSLGSQIKSVYLKSEVITAILQVFSKLPQKILWKSDSEIEDLPGNVLVRKWIPQMGLLGHPNVKLFITHGGVLSFTEAVYFGVPMLCLPINGDQWMNAAFIESRKLGLILKLTETDKLFGAIRAILGNPLYTKNIKYHQSLLRDQPIKPMDKAIFWVEHVIKYKGAPHLQPFSIKLPWYKYYLLDVIACLLLILVVFLKILVCFTKYSFRLLRVTEKQKVS